ncbi:MAG: hypothetical protein NC489_36615, partial [Ruminococcus flavefaciens]|nr:hypothetical protein [Ruminococcus flavefaciens]
MADIDKFMVDIYKEDLRFMDILVDGKPLTEAQIEFIKAYEQTTGELFYVTEENMICLNKGTYLADVTSSGSTIYKIASTYYKAGCLYQKGEHFEAYKMISEFTYGAVITDLVINNLAILMTTAAINPLVTFAALIVLGYAVGECGEFLGDVVADSIKSIIDLFNDAGAYTYPVDPLIFDLNGDGVKTV